MHDTAPRADDQRRSSATTIAVVIGPAASGKTTIGERLAAALGWPFLDADDLHPESNRERMAQGLPLEDRHRWPWLDAVHSAMRDFATEGRSAVVACSALKRAYRDRLRGDLDGVRFFDLLVPRDVLAARIGHRKGHFFPPALLDSQLATHERGDDAEPVDGDRPPDAIVAAIVDRLRG